MTSPMTWSRPAMCSVSSAVWRSRWVRVGPSPWSAATTSGARALTSSGSQQVEERAEGVEQRGEVERGPGVLHGDGGAVVKGQPSGTPALEGEVPLAEKVEIGDLGADAVADR